MVARNRRDRHSDPATCRGRAQASKCGGAGAVFGCGRMASGAAETRSQAQQRSDAERAYNEVFEGLAASPELSERDLGAIWRSGGNHWRAAA